MTKRQSRGYLKRLLKKQAELKPGLYVAKVAHDDWCNIFKGKECNCHPDITLVDKTKDD